MENNWCEDTVSINLNEVDGNDWINTWRFLRNEPLLRPEGIKIYACNKKT